MFEIICLLYDYCFFMNIIRMNVNDPFIDMSNTFYQWTFEDHQSPLYKNINDTSLSDDYNIFLKKMIYINNLRHAIIENLLDESIKIYKKSINCKFNETLKKDRDHYMNWIFSITKKLTHRIT